MPQFQQFAGHTPQPGSIAPLAFNAIFPNIFYRLSTPHFAILARIYYFKNAPAFVSSPELTRTLGKARKTRSIREIEVTCIPNSDLRQVRIWPATIEQQTEAFRWLYQPHVAIPARIHNILVFYMSPRLYRVKSRPNQMHFGRKTAFFGVLKALLQV